MASSWAPFTLSWDDHVPIDISFAFEKEKPAGKHGYLKVQGDRFAFEDGSEARFWGTCFNSGANFPPHGYSEMVARRLAKFGVNIVRTHQMDAEWSTPNIFQFSRALPKDNTRSFDPESIDRLDYLFHCLKEEGIYIYLDLLTYRQFRSGDGVEAADQLPGGHSPYPYFDPHLIALQKEFNRDLWMHINPYTGLAYKDDPAIALTELVNEADLFVIPPTVEPYRSRLETMYRAWADREGVRVPGEKVDFAHPDQQCARFMCQVQMDFYREMIAHLRSIGVRVPINGTNYSWNLAVISSQVVADYRDSHVYWNFPHWEEAQGTTTIPMVSAPATAFCRLSCARSLKQPFFASEWDHAWPDEWRAESPVAYAAVGAFQGWSGFTIHTYRYSTWAPENRLGGGGSTINGITYRKHFDSFNDPAKFGLFYHAALITRRGDVRRGERTVAVVIPDDMPDWHLKKPADIPALTALSEAYRMGTVLPGDEAQADATVPPGEPAVDLQTGEVRSDTGELYRSWKRRIGWVDTPRTKAAYGFLGEAGRIALEGLALEVKTDFATIALSSLTDDAIAESADLLLTAVGRCDNTDARYDDGHTRQLDVGHAPILIQVIEAKVEMRTSRPNLKVWVISEHGEAVCRLPTEYKDGVLHFEIGPQPSWNPSTMYYLIRI